MILNKNSINHIRGLYGESCYLLDCEKFKTNYRNLIQALKAVYPNINLAYSFKTNYIPQLCKIVLAEKGYAEIVSDLELDLAGKVGFDAKSIIWNGPAKKRDRLMEFLLNGGTANLDSIEEVRIVESFANENPGHTISVGIRCNFDVGDGAISRFGFDIDGEGFNTAIKIIKTSSNIVLDTIQIHFASRDAASWIARSKGMVEILKKLDTIPSRIDLGGGFFGIMPDSLKSQFYCEIPSFQEYADLALRPLAEYLSGTSCYPEIIFEPGTAIVGDCMEFMCSVKSIKTIRGKRFATVSSSQCNINMKSVNPPIKVIAMGEPSHKYTNVDIVGYTCIEGDVIYKNYSGKLAINDAVVISNCGSYSIVMKPPFILPNFPIIGIDGSKPYLIKRAETYNDVFQSYIN